MCQVENVTLLCQLNVVRARCIWLLLFIIISIGARINDKSTPNILNVYQFTKDTSIFWCRQM